MITVSTLRATAIISFVLFAATPYLQAASSSGTSDPHHVKSLINAAIAGDLALVKQVMQEHNIPADARAKNGSMAIHYAAQQGSPRHIEIVNYFITEEHMHPDIRGTCGRTCMHWAAENGNCALISFLSAHGASVNIDDEFCKYPLHMAAGLNHPDAVKLLLALKADPKAKDLEQRTALAHACMTGNIDSVGLLIESYDPSQDIEVCSPVHVAALFNHAHLIDFLVRQGLDPNAVTDRKFTPLHAACMRKSFSAARQLLRHRSGIHAVTDDGNTPLHIACGARDALTARLLVDGGASYRAQNNSMVTPLDIAAEEGLEELVIFFVTHESLQLQQPMAPLSSSTDSTPGETSTIEVTDPPLDNDALFDEDFAAALKLSLSERRGCRISEPGSSIQPHSPVCRLPKATSFFDYFYDAAEKGIVDLNELKEIQDAALIKQISLHSNRIRILPKAAFAHMPVLHYLDLRNNDITKVEEGVFAGIPGLQQLLLSTNLKPEVLKEIESNLINYCPFAVIKTDSHFLRGNPFTMR